MLPHALQFFLARADCRECGKAVFAVARTCPYCGRRYPTARKAFYWTYIVLIILGIPSLALFVLWYYLGVKV